MDLFASLFLSFSNIRLKKSICPRYPKNLLNSGWKMTIKLNATRVTIERINTPRIVKSSATRTSDKIHKNTKTTAPLTNFSECVFLINFW